jgi:hypothetical protein
LQHRAKVAGVDRVPQIARHAERIEVQLMELAEHSVLDEKHDEPLENYAVLLLSLLHCAAQCAALPYGAANQRLAVCFEQNYALLD